MKLFKEQALKFNRYADKIVRIHAVILKDGALNAHFLRDLNMII